MVDDDSSASFEWIVIDATNVLVNPVDVPVNFTVTFCDAPGAIENAPVGLTIWKADESLSEIELMSSTSAPVLRIVSEALSCTTLAHVVSGCSMRLKTRRSQNGAPSALLKPISGPVVTFDAGATLRMMPT